MGAIATVKNQLSATRRQLADTRSPTKAAYDGVFTLGGAGAAGAIDRFMGPTGLGGVRASAAGGLAVAAVSYAMGSARGIQVATGMLAPTAYDFGSQALVASGYAPPTTA